MPGTPPVDGPVIFLPGRSRWEGASAKTATPMLVSQETAEDAPKAICCWIHITTATTRPMEKLPGISRVRSLYYTV